MPLYKCTNIFSKFWCQIHFLVEYESYLYREDALSNEEVSLNRQLVFFLIELGYTSGVTPHDVALKKRLKHFIVTNLLVYTNTKESRKIIFDE